MGKSRVVNISEIMDTKKNPTLCLSALRYVGECQRCEKFKRKFKGDLKTMKIDCNPQFNEKALGKLKRKTELKTQLKEIKKELKELE